MDLYNRTDQHNRIKIVSTSGRFPLRKNWYDLVHATSINDPTHLEIESFQLKLGETLHKMMIMAETYILLPRHTH